MWQARGYRFYTHYLNPPTAPLSPITPPAQTRKVKLRQYKRFSCGCRERRRPDQGSHTGLSAHKSLLLFIEPHVLKSKNMTRKEKDPVSYTILETIPTTGCGHAWRQAGREGRERGRCWPSVSPTPPPPPTTPAQ